MLTDRQRRLARRAAKAIPWLDDRMDAMLDDPMTHAMGAPVDEFYEQDSARHRKMLWDLLQDPDLPARSREELEREFERYMP